MLDEQLKSAQILVVDDQDANVLLLEDILSEVGYTKIRSVTDSRKVLPLFADTKPDIVLLDLHMPHLDGFAIMERLAPFLEAGAYLPILVLTADITPEARQRALSMGAKDFVTKPFDNEEVLLRIHNLLETRFLHLQIRDENLLLEVRVRQRTRDLEEARVEILARLAKAAEFRDDITGKHTYRVGEMAARLAAALGSSQAEVELVRLAAPLHDVGKIGIPDRILLKPAALTSDEYTVMRTHTTIGAEILSGSHVPLLMLAKDIALTHHEQWDGRGYPRGLRADEIPQAGRLVAVVDTYDTITHDRPYRVARSPEEALEILSRGAGTLWDPSAIEAFITLPKPPPDAAGANAPGAGTTSRAAPEAAKVRPRRSRRDLAR